MTGKFTNLWTFAEAARNDLSWRSFFRLLWENTSGYLLAACAVSLVSVALSWVYMVRAGPTPEPSSFHRHRRSSSRWTVERHTEPVVDSCNTSEPEEEQGEDDEEEDEPAEAGERGRDGALPPPPELSDAAHREEALAGDETVPDLVDMAHHLPARVKRAELRSIRNRLQRDMSSEQMEEEKRVEMDQMADILTLMQQNSDKFGTPTLDDMKSQLGLYM